MGGCTNALTGVGIKQPPQLALPRAELYEQEGGGAWGHV